MTHIQREAVKSRKTARKILLNGEGAMHASNSVKMKYDPDWYKLSMSYNPLQLITLIEKTVLAQTKEQYPFATV